jgi:hypothetical protein
MWQLDESMGTHLVNTSTLPAAIFGVQQNPAATAQACADSCSVSGTCIGSTWIYDDTTSGAANTLAGRCIWYIINPFGGHTLYVKVLPMDYMAGATTGQAAVTTGHYVRYQSASPNLGITISNTTATGLPDCKAACDNSVQCWGFYYNGFCILRKGLEGEGHRSWIHVIGSQVE